MNKRISEEAYYNRLRQLANVENNGNNQQKSNSLGDLINYKRGGDGIAYGIVRENHNYYIKKGNSKQNPDISDFVYIGGLSNISDYQYKTLAEADKNRNMLFKVINESLKYKTNKTSSKLVLNEDETEKEIEMASSKIDDLETATDAAATPEPDMGDEEDGKATPEPDMDDEEDGKATPEPDMDDEEDGEATPEPDMDDEEDGEATPEPDMDDEEGDINIDDELLVSKEIEKNLGKLTNKIRKIDLEPIQIKSYVNTFLSAFDGKFKDVDIEDRKSMADKILKIVSTDDIDDLSDNVEDTDTELDECDECGSFKKYAESRGYTVESILECGDDEMSSLISGYANNFNESLNDGDFEDVALYTNENILKSLSEEYGHDNYVDNLSEYVNKLSETNDNRIDKIKESWNAVKDPSNIEVQPNVVNEENEENEEEDFVNSINVDNEENSDEPISFAPEGEPIGGGLPKPDGSETTGVDVDVDGQNKTVNIKMSESELKLRKYIRYKLLEYSGKKKPSLNENNKSDKLKKLDESIKKIYENELKKKINKSSEVNEIFGFSLKEKFNKLDPNDDKGVDDLFKSVFSKQLTGTYKGSYLRAYKNTNTEERYNIIKQYIENNNKGALITNKENKLEYSETSPLKQSGAISGSAGFNAGY